MPMDSPTLMGIPGKMRIRKGFSLIDVSELEVSVDGDSHGGRGRQVYSQPTSLPWTRQWRKKQAHFYQAFNRRVLPRRKMAL
jgi:hypothetical protein